MYFLCVFYKQEQWYTKGASGRPARGSLEYHLKYLRRTKQDSCQNFIQEPVAKLDNDDHNVTYGKFKLKYFYVR